VSRILWDGAIIILVAAMAGSVFGALLTVVIVIEVTR
jgi:hypothetical protein